MKIHSQSNIIADPFRALILVVALTLAGLPLHGQAQSDTDGDQDKKETTLEEVVVSASRIPVPAEHVGSSVSVFDQDDFDKRQVRYVHEMLRESPGMAVNQYSDTGQTQIRMRGGEGNHTLILFDGIEMNDPAIADEFYLNNLPVFSSGRIEVLRGPQSSVYGSEAIGGVVNIVSPTPSEGTTAAAQVEYGSLNTTNAKSYLGVAREGNFFSVTANHIKSKGISARANNTEHDGIKQTGAHLKFGYQITDHLDVSTTALLVNNDSDYDNCGWPSSDNCQAEDRKRAFGITFALAQLDGELDHQFRMSSTRHRRTDYINGVLDPPRIGKKSKFDYQVAWQFAVGTIDQTVIFAVEKERNEAVGRWIGSGQGGNFKTTSYSFEKQLDFENDVFVTVSARHDDNKGGQFKDRNTYRGALAWLINERVRLHMSSGTGAKNPTVSELYGSTGEWEENPNLLPETSKGWDLGAEFQLRSMNLTMDVTYFNNRITNLIDRECVRNCTDNDYTNDVYRSINLRGVSTTKGWEFSAHGTVANHYEVTAAATFLSAFDSTGLELTRRPSQIASINVSRDLTLFDRSGSVNVNVRHSGKQVDLVPWPTRGDLAKFTLVSVGTDLQLNPNLDLTANVENLFDEDYQEVFGYNKPGRTISVGLRYTF